MVTCVKPYLGSILLKEISVNSDLKLRDFKKKDEKYADARHNIKKHKIKLNSTIGLMPIKPYIDLFLEVNGVKTSGVKFVFSLDTDVNVKNIEVNSDSNNYITINVKTITAILKLSISKVLIYYFNKPNLDRTIQLDISMGKKEIRLYDFPIYPNKSYSNENRLQTSNMRAMEGHESVAVKNDLIDCPMCSFRNSFDSRFCIHCGSDLRTYSCINCKSNNPIGSSFCKSCGVVLR
jgi:Double zinc ribbon